jgi:hypothetical protein
MKWSSIFCALIVSAALATEAKAQTNAVMWGAGQPTTAAGSISGSGTYTTAAGWTAVSVSMTALPTGGGMGTTVGGAAPAGGNWGKITINGLPTGSYTVVVTIGYRKAGSLPMAIGSPISIVSVP